MLGVVVSILPVFLLLGALVLIDSYKLVAFKSVLLSVGAGLLAGLVSYLVNLELRPALGLEAADYSMYVAPVVEESLKAICLLYLLLRNRVGYILGWLVQFAAIGLGFVVPVMFVLGALYAGLWVTAMVLGRRIDEAKRARDPVESV